MSDLPLSKSTSPTPGASDADGEPRSPAFLAAARASRALAARRAQDVTPMPMAALPQSLTPAVATAGALDGGVTFNGQEAVSTDRAAGLQVARQAIKGLTSGASSSSAPGSAGTLPSLNSVISTVAQQPAPQTSPSLDTLAGHIRSMPSEASGGGKSPAPLSAVLNQPLDGNAQADLTTDNTDLNIGAPRPQRDRRFCFACNTAHTTKWIPTGLGLLCDQCAPLYVPNVPAAPKLVSEQRYAAFLAQTIVPFLNNGSLEKQSKVSALQVQLTAATKVIAGITSNQVAQGIANLSIDGADGTLSVEAMQAMAKAAESRAGYMSNQGYSAYMEWKKEAGGYIVDGKLIKGKDDSLSNRELCSSCLGWGQYHCSLTLRNYTSQLPFQDVALPPGSLSRELRCRTRALKIHCELRTHTMVH